MRIAFLFFVQTVETHKLTFFVASTEGWKPKIDQPTELPESPTVQALARMFSRVDA